MKLLLAASIAVLSGATPWSSSLADEVRVYRCTDATGAIALQDSPCPSHQTEEVRELRRPIDAPIVPRAPAPMAAPETPSPPAQEVVVRHVDAAPLYECLRHDGSRYESESGVPERRWVPLWTLGLDPRAPATTFGNVGRPKPNPPLNEPRAQLPAPAPGAYAAGAWVEDRCYRLPAGVACERRRERVSELGRRIFNAVRQSEREQMALEQRGLQEQLRAECG